MENELGESRSHKKQEQMLAARKESGEEDASEGQSIAVPFREGVSCGLAEVSRRGNLQGK
jgi:hypothetical protein